MKTDQELSAAEEDNMLEYELENWRNSSKYKKDHKYQNRETIF